MDTHPLVLTGRRTPLRRADAHFMSDCPECERCAVSLVLWTRGRVVIRLVGRVTGTHLSRYMAQLSCGHIVEIEEGDLEETIQKLIGGPPEADTHCRRCKVEFDLTDTPSADSARQYRATSFCKGCIDNCHDSDNADHMCVIDLWMSSEIRP